MNALKKLAALITTATLCTAAVASTDSPDVSAAALEAHDGIGFLEYPSTDKRAYLTEKEILFIRPGLNIDFTAEDIKIESDGSVSVTFSVTDDRGQPLDIDGNETPGPMNISWVLSFIPQGEQQYLSYFTRTQNSSITGNSAVQATADAGGTFERLELGVYTYHFGGTLPADFDANATHTMGVYAERNLEEFELGGFVESGTVDFIPAGGEVTQIRELVTDQACNNCHDDLVLHGRRRGNDLCILCHYDGVIDPDTGNDVDFREMVHKIHRGEDLPSVQAGVPYQIIGFRNSVHDYSELVFPQDIRNCTTCHADQAAQADLHKTNPTRASCGSCHDDVDFDTGENHAGGPAISDRFCANCHFPEGEFEFDASVVGAHTIPTKSDQLAGINIEFLEVTSSNPGNNPTVRFNLTTDAGMPLNPADLDTFRITIAGATTDYSTVMRETANTAVSAGVDGEFTYTFADPIPSDAEGSWTVSAEIREPAALNAGLTSEMTVTESTFVNPTLTFAVTDGAPDPRRMVVDTDSCNACHDVLSLHGGQRFSIDYCVMCHNPVADDSDVRPPEFTPPRSIDFRFMIHRIHLGEENMRDYTIFGFRSSVHNYNNLLYPGDLRNCNACHVNNSQQVPTPGVLAVQSTENEFFAPIEPQSAACLGCHDSLEAASHAFLNTAPFGESCGACHGEGKEFAVDRVHARNE